VFLDSTHFASCYRPYLLHKYTEGPCWISSSCGRIMYGYPLSQQIFRLLHQTRRIIKVSSLDKNILMKTSVLNVTPHTPASTAVYHGSQLTGTNTTITSKGQQTFGSKNLWSINNENTKYPQKTKKVIKNLFLIKTDNFWKHNYINPFRSYVGPRPTLWFSCSAPMSEDVRHVFVAFVARPLRCRSLSDTFPHVVRTLANR
jgi:hypothetical protein